MNHAGVAPASRPFLDRTQVLAVLAAWAVARVVVAVAWVVAQAAERSPDAPSWGGRLHEGLVAWDGQWYLRIAEDGYRSGGDEVRFFPLFPALGRVVGTLVGGADVGLVVVANVAALVAMVLLAWLVTEATGDRALALRSVWALALWPASFVLTFGYAESLLLAASVGVAVAARRRAWWWAAAAGLVAGVARPNGLAVVVLSAGAALPALRSRPWPTDVAARMAAAVAPLAGFAVVLVGASRWHGDPWAPVTAQSALRGDLVDPGSRLVRGFGDLLGDERFADGLHLPFAVAAVVLVALVAVNVGRVEALYCAVVVVVALSADNWNSLERYLLNAFPLFWALGAAMAHRAVERTVLAIGSAGLVALTLLTWTGAYVP